MAQAAVSWSPQQQEFLNFAIEGFGSCVLEAVAGAGKTTTLLAAAEDMPGQVAILAYNKKIADEIKEKLAKRGITYRKAQGGTVHSFGYSAFRKEFPNVRIEPEKVAKIAEEMIEPRQLEDAPVTLADYASVIVKLVSLAKQRALGVVESFGAEASWTGIIEHFGLLDDIEIELPEGVEHPVAAIVAMAKEILRASNRDTDTIDFDDMVYLPLVYKLRFWTFDVVMVDEAQDTNPARRALVRAIVKPRGRVIAVGDRHQAIYGFCHPPGTTVLTPSGSVPIETLNAGDPVILGDTAGNVAGWSGGHRIIQKHEFDYDEDMITLDAGGASAPMTIHHRVPVKIDPSARFFTYIMARNGVFRAGCMAAYGSAGQTKGGKPERRFMLSQRCILEGCDSAWLLQSFSVAEDARKAADVLARRIKNTTFNQMTDEMVAALPSEMEEAIAILREHGRRVEFPFQRADDRNDRKASHAFITEACNVMDGMLVSALGEFDSRQRGRSRQRSNWHPVRVSRAPYKGKTHGITVPVLQKRAGYAQWPLYYAGGLLVHNTGADNDALDQIARDFACIRLPLTVTYRCPKAVVEFARQWVDHIQAAETAPEGKVSEIDMDGFLSLADMGAGDAVLCRNTKPLVSLAFALIRRRIPCRVEGKDIAARLKSYTKRWKVRSIDDFLDRLDAWFKRQSDKLVKAGKIAAIQPIEDCVETLRVIAQQCLEEGKTRLTDIVAFLDEVFADNVTDVLVLSTIHKSKGREFQRVFWLDRQGTCPSRYARQPWEIEQEKNLCYVAATRAQRILIELKPAAAKPANQERQAA